MECISSMNFGEMKYLAVTMLCFVCNKCTVVSLARSAIIFMPSFEHYDSESVLDKPIIVTFHEQANFMPVQKDFFDPTKHQSGNPSVQVPEVHSCNASLKGESASVRTVITSDSLLFFSQKTSITEFMYKLTILLNKKVM